MKNISTIKKIKIIPGIDYFFYMTHIYGKKFQNSPDAFGGILVYIGLLALHLFGLYALIDIFYPFIEENAEFAQSNYFLLMFGNLGIIIIFVFIQLIWRYRYKGVINYFEQRIINNKFHLKYYRLYIYSIHLIVFLLFVLAIRFN